MASVIRDSGCCMRARSSVCSECWAGVGKTKKLQPDEKYCTIPNSFCFATILYSAIVDQLGVRCYSRSLEVSCSLCVFRGASPCAAASSFPYTPFRPPQERATNTDSNVKLTYIYFCQVVRRFRRASPVQP